MNPQGKGKIEKSAETCRFSRKECDMNPIACNQLFKDGCDCQQYDAVPQREFPRDIR
jgi:hypothetical protein